MALSEGNHKMTAPRESRNQIPVGELEQFMCYLANLKFVGEVGAEDLATFTRRLRLRTQKYWPELWQSVEGEPTDVEERARNLIKTIRRYLQLFWREPDARARDWYIYNARLYHHRLRVMPEYLKYPEPDRFAVSEILLSQPPELTNFEKALFRLQERARFPSKAPLYCRNENCVRPYFLSEEKGTKFCSKECARPSKLASKRTSEKKRNKQRRTQ
jgi:hypothetical protein